MRSIDKKRTRPVDAERSADVKAWLDIKKPANVMGLAD